MVIMNVLNSILLWGGFIQFDDIVPSLLESCFVRGLDFGDFVTAAAMVLTAGPIWSIELTL